MKHIISIVIVSMGHRPVISIQNKLLLIMMHLTFTNNYEMGFSKGYS
jgi:hypothetical protein